MIYVLFILIFCMLLALNIVVHKQNNYFQQHGLNAIGRVVAIEEKTIMRRKGGGSYVVQLPVIEYAHKGQMWQLESDVHAPLQHQMGEIVNLVVHPKLPIAMTKKELEQRQLLSWIFKGVLIVPIGLCIGFYAMGQGSQFMLFEQFGITSQHVDDIIASVVIMSLLVKFFPMWKRWKAEQTQGFMGLTYNSKVISGNSDTNEQPSCSAISG